MQHKLQNNMQNMIMMQYVSAICLIKQLWGLDVGRGGDVPSLQKWSVYHLTKQLWQQKHLNGFVSLVEGDILRIGFPE